MNKVIISCLCLFIVNASSDAQSITVDAYKDSWVILLEQGKYDDLPYGWWSEWQNRKAAGDYFYTPHKFENLEPGTYTLAVYLPESSTFDPNFGDNDEASDGLGLENIEVGPNDDLEFYFKKTDFKVWNCMSCPWLYVFDGKEFVKTTEVLKDLVGCEREATTRHALPASLIKNGKIRIRIQEEKDEISFIDRVALRWEEGVMNAQSSSRAVRRQLRKKDGDYLILKKGEFVELEFKVPKRLAGQEAFLLETEGYYEPDEIFLKEVFETYQRKTSK
jgi:hypothetical protein